MRSNQKYALILCPHYVFFECRHSIREFGYIPFVFLLPLHNNSAAILISDSIQPWITADNSHRTEFANRERIYTHTQNEILNKKK